MARSHLKFCPVLSNRILFYSAIKTNRGDFYLSGGDGDLSDDSSIRDDEIYSSPGSYRSNMYYRSKSKNLRLSLESSSEGVFIVARDYKQDSIFWKRYLMKNFNTFCRWAIIEFTCRRLMIFRLSIWVMDAPSGSLTVTWVGLKVTSTFWPLIPS